jgi:hypothetical protein
VQGSVTLGGNDVQISPDTPLLARRARRVLFSEKGFQLAACRRARSAATSAGGGTRRPRAGEPAPCSCARRARSRAEGLRQARELGFARAAGARLPAAAPATTWRWLPPRPPEVQVTSTLQGWPATCRRR